ncbi:MAG TPA: hypothetical protein VF516_24335 [Kofleriaceae bacterium]
MTIAYTDDEVVTLLRFAFRKDPHHLGASALLRAIWVNDDSLAVDQATACGQSMGRPHSSVRFGACR